MVQIDNSFDIVNSLCTLDVESVRARFACWTVSFVAVGGAKKSAFAGVVKTSAAFFVKVQHCGFAVGTRFLLVHSQFISSLQPERFPCCTLLCPYHTVFVDLITLFVLLVAAGKALVCSEPFGTLQLNFQP